MDKGRAKRGAVGFGGVILGVLLTLVLAALAVAAVYFWASRQAGPTALREEKELSARHLSLYAPGEAVSNPAPVPAAAADPAAAEEELPFDIVEVLGEEEGLLVARIQGKRFKGFIAIVDDPLRLSVATCPYFGEKAGGRTVKQMADAAGAVLAINGGGFSDPGGGGSGGMPTGNVIVDGVVRYAGGGSTVGMDANGVLHVGEFTSARCRELGLQWAVSYGPTLIVDGEIRGRLDNNLQEPRTAVGQREDGTVILLNIQGRQVSALGVTCRELAQILYSYGCVNAGNLDGGASADMYYRGEYVNICNTSGGPRPLPTAVLVAPVSGEEAEG